MGPVALYWCGFAISFSFFFIFPSDPRVGDLRLPPAGLPHCLVSARPPLLLLAGILHGLAVPSMALSLQLRALPYRSPLQPLGLAALPHSFVKRSPCPPRRARGPCPPPGALPCVPPGGVRGPLSGSGRPSPPWVVEGSPAVAPCGMRLFLLAALLLSPPSSLHPGSEGGPGPLCHASPPAVPTGSPSFLVIFFFHLLCCALLHFVLLLHPLWDCSAVDVFGGRFSWLLRGLCAHHLLGSRAPFAGLLWQGCLHPSALLSGCFCVSV